MKQFYLYQDGRIIPAPREAPASPAPPTEPPPVHSPAPALNTRAIHVADFRRAGEGDWTSAWHAAFDHWRLHGGFVVASGTMEVGQITLPAGKGLVIEGRDGARLVGSHVARKLRPVGDSEVPGYCVVFQEQAGSSRRVPVDAPVRPGDNRLMARLAGARVGDMLVVRTEKRMYDYRIGHVARVAAVAPDWVAVDPPFPYDLDPRLDRLEAQTFEPVTDLEWLGVDVECAPNGGQYGLYLTHAIGGRVAGARFFGDPRGDHGVNHVGLCLARGIGTVVEEIEAHGFLEPRSWGYGAQMAGHGAILRNSRFSWNKHSVAGGYGNYVTTGLRYENLEIYGTIVVGLDMHPDVHSGEMIDCTVDGLGDWRYGSTYGAHGGAQSRGPNCTIRGLRVRGVDNFKKVKGLLLSGRYGQVVEDAVFENMRYAFRLNENRAPTEISIRNIQCRNVEIFMIRDPADRVDLDMSTVSGEFATFEQVSE